MRRHAALAALLAVSLLPTRGLAQEVRLKGPLPESSSDSATQHYIDLLLGLRDTVDAVGAQAGQFRRDLRSAGEETVLSQGGLLNARCRAARGAIEHAAPAFAPTRVPAPARAASGGIRGNLRALARALADQCVTGLPPSGPGVHADTLRAWGPYRTAQLYRAIALYEGSVTEFTASLGVRLPTRRPRH